jgi:PAS domain S-box-containing protein
MAEVEILIVEDEMIVARHLSRTLESIGYKVAGAASRGSDAVRMAGEKSPHIVLMDIMLEGDVDGIEAATQIRDKFGIPVIYLTSYTDTTILERAKLTEPYGYLVKPFSEKELRSSIETAIYKVEMERSLRQSQQRYQSLAEAAFEGIVITDSNSVILDVNKSFCEIIGKKRESLIGAELGDLAASHKAWELKSFLSSVSEEILETEMLKADGHHGQVEIRGKTIPYKDKSAWVYSIRDISERIKAQKMMVEARSLKAVQDLSSGVAHHFNNMLQITMGHAQTGLFNLEKRDFDKVRTNFEHILESSRFGAEIVRRLQDFTALRSINVGEEQSVFDLGTTVEHAVELSKPFWKSSPEKDGLKISLTMHIAPDCYVEGRENELFEVVVSLLKNAAEALPWGGQIGVALSTLEDSVILQVQDDGVGIEEKNAQSVFEPFWTTKGYQTLGMGLAVSKGVIIRHNGSITIESKKDEGTLVTVTLPLAKVAQDDSEGSDSGEFRAKLRIMAIDDTPSVLEIISMGLRHFGHEVTTAGGGHEALKIYDPDIFDLVICDLGMPEVSGWDVGARIKEICAAKNLPKTPFILLTGWIDQFLDKSRLNESGVDKTARKPILVPELLKLASGLIKEGA